MLYFIRGSNSWVNDFNIRQIEVTPVVDSNGDAKVDGLDLMIPGTHWGQDYPPCDIAPLPLGDGIVDVRNLLTLAAYMDPVN